MGEYLVFKHLFVFLLSVLLCSCSTTRLVVRRDLDKNGEIFEFHGSQKHVLWMLIDGANAAVFRRMLESGELPNIYTHIYRRGPYTFYAMASHVPNTYPNIAAQLTGKFPGHVGVPNNQYLDTEYKDRINLIEYPGILQARNLLRNELTIFNYLKAQRLYSVSVTDLLATSANVQVIDLFKTGVKEINKQYDRIDKRTFADLASVIEESSKTNQLPALMYAHLIGPDSTGHLQGITSEEYLASLRLIDKEFGKLVTLIYEKGYYDDFAFVISSDHGQIPFKNRFNFDGFLYEMLKEKPKGFCKTSRCKIDEGRIGDVVFVHGADRDAFIYFRVGDLESFYKKGRGERITLEELLYYTLPSGKSVNIIDEISRGEGVGLIFARESDNKFHVFSKSGHSLITRSKLLGFKPEYSYEILGGKDPLELDVSRVPAQQGDFLSSRDWLALTEQSPYPDAIPQIPELFQTLKTGDLIVYASPAYTFSDEYVSGHGGGTRPEMYTPFLFGGEGLGRRDLGPFRTIDITPTILHFMGLRVNPVERIDGETACVFLKYCPYLEQ